MNTIKFRSFFHTFFELSQSFAINIVVQSCMCVKILITGHSKVTNIIIGHINMRKNVCMIRASKNWKHMFPQVHLKMCK